MDALTWELPNDQLRAPEPGGTLYRAAPRHDRQLVPRRSS